VHLSPAVLATSARQSALGAVRIRRRSRHACCGNGGRLLEVLQQLPDLPDELEQRVSGNDTSSRQFSLTLVHTYNSALALTSVCLHRTSTHYLLTAKQ